MFARTFGTDRSRELRLTATISCGTPLPPPREGITQSKDTTLSSRSLEACHIVCCLKGGDPSCTAGMVLRIFSGTDSPPVSAAPSLPHMQTRSLSRAAMLKRSPEAVFTRSRLSLHYLELLMRRAMWTWNWKQMFDSAAKSLWLPLPLKPFTYVWYLIKKTRFLDDTFGIWVNCFSQKPKDFYSVSTKCSDVSFVVLLVLASILDMK